MKPNPWIYPALAAVGVSLWIGYQKNSAGKIEREIFILTERIRQTHALETADQKSRAGEEKAKEKKIDWRGLSAKLGQMRNGGMPDMKAMLKLQRLIMEMTPEELIAQIDEIEALDLPEASRLQLEQMLLGKLSEKNPELVLQRFIDQIGKENSPIQYSMISALNQWAEKDPRAAAAWFDQQIAAGIFDSKSLDGKSESRINFERAMINALLKTDLQAATARALALPEDQRANLFNQGYFFGTMTPDQQSNYATLIRSSLSPENARDSLAQMAGVLSFQAGYERIDQFISETRATDSEKKAIVSKVMSNQLMRNQSTEIDRETLEKARTWAAIQSPSSVDQATGDALGQSLWTNKDFAKTSALVLEYQQSSGSDDVLVSFLENQATQSRSGKEAKALIAQIKDPSVREKIQNLPGYKSE